MTKLLPWVWCAVFWATLYLKFRSLPSQLKQNSRKWCHAQQTSPYAPQLPPGEVIGVILEPLTVYFESVVTIAILPYAAWLQSYKLTPPKTPHRLHRVLMHHAWLADSSITRVYECSKYGAWHRPNNDNNGQEVILETIHGLWRFPWRDAGSDGGGVHHHWLLLLSVLLLVLLLLLRQVFFTWRRVRRRNSAGLRRWWNRVRQRRVL